MKHIDGTRTDLLRILSEHGVRTGAEIGVADGKFSLALCKALPNLVLYCIDPWVSYRGNRRGGSDTKHAQQYNLARERLAPYHAVLMRATSVDAVSHFTDESLDFVFIDANHDYAYVRDDIPLWSAKVKRGGIVSGHDFYEFREAGVIQAVEDYAFVHSIEYTVIGEMRKHRDDNANPCWYWEKR